VKVLVAGAPGFVGRRLCPVLAAAGHHVVAMTRTRPATPGELVRATGLGKATVYRLYPTKDALIAAYLRRLAATIGAAIGEEITARTKAARAARYSRSSTPSRPTCPAPASAAARLITPSSSSTTRSTPPGWKPALPGAAAGQPELAGRPARSRRWRPGRGRRGRGWGVFGCPAGHAHRRRLHQRRPPGPGRARRRRPRRRLAPGPAGQDPAMSDSYEHVLVED